METKVIVAIAVLHNMTRYLGNGDDFEDVEVPREIITVCNEERNDKRNNITAALIVYSSKIDIYAI